MDITVPTVGESVSEAVVSAWLVNEGEWVERDAPVVVLETDKANMEVAAPTSGKLTRVVKPVGQTVTVGEVIGVLEPGSAAAVERPATGGGEAAVAAPKSPPNAVVEPSAKVHSARAAEIHATPSARRLMMQQQVDAARVQPSGPAGRVTRQDVLAAMSGPPDDGRARVPDEPRSPDRGGPLVGPSVLEPAREGKEQWVPMTLLRKRVAQRLVEAQHTAALLTTFNEVDMSAILDLRKRMGEAFLKKHGVKLGLMSFFLKATIEALKSWPVLNAEVRGDDIVYRNYFNIGVAVGTDRGLVVPVVNHADQLSFAETEMCIADLAARSRAGKLRPDELAGGTFTITNGGTYGSLLSTPIVNPPQSGILGMHKIEERPVARNSQVIIRPMMYLAVTYDHRIIDGREAVAFLVQIREGLEDPARMLLEV